MAIVNRNKLKEVYISDLPKFTKMFVLAHAVETDLSEAFYKFRCRLRGGRFERLEPDNPTGCYLVTKKSSVISVKTFGFITRLRPLRPQPSGLLLAIRPFRNLYRRKKKKDGGSVTFTLIKLELRELEVYELQCPGGATYNARTGTFASRFGRKENCAYCGRCLEVQTGDRRIAGKF